MTTEPPSLPYVRDECSTSQHLSAYPSYPPNEPPETPIDIFSTTQIDHHQNPDLLDPDGSDIAETASALQYWTAKRHISGKGKAKEDEENVPWRLRSRSKTLNAGMFICLNLGVDPPDIVKTNPCAKLECWLDPTALPGTKAIEAIGRNLQQQFETLNPKVKFKTFLDPSVEDTKKQCTNLRKVARDERTVFYYNGHGVPKPTPSGEIWVFNKNYTQYIPVSLYDLQDWLGSPTVYVWECSGAGNILNNFAKAAERKDNEAKASQAAREGTGPNTPQADLPGSSYADAIHLAACQSNQILPMSPDLPADLFTCCLTSPIETSLRHFVLQDPLRRNISTSPGDPRSKITVDMVMRIPGDLKDRRTPLGELNWIFTAVTDTIAWSAFPREIFNRLFRQDLLVAALFRNFLLAQRIMTAYHCTPMSIPELPSTHNHPLWNSWDLAVDACLAQLPDLLDQQAKFEAGQTQISPLSGYRPSTFFAQHLQAFEVWLQHGGAATTKVVSTKNGIRSKGLSHRPPPEQLPIVLQVLLSQAHRLRALILLSRFVDLGPWAVHLSLSIGIFPYVQKLLQSPAVELKPVLIFIWARILAVDKSCQVDLLRDASYNYFAQILSPIPITGTGGTSGTTGAPLVIPNANEHRAMCAFILSILCRNFKPGQSACMAINIFEACIARMSEEDWLLKTWCLLCIAQLWADNDEAKSLFMGPAQGELLGALKSTAVEVRAAALYAFAVLLGASSAPIDNLDSNKGGGGTGAQLGMTESAQLDLEAGLAFACIMAVKEDASPMVRRELVVIISCVVREWRGWAVCAAWVYYEQEAALAGGDHSSSTGALGKGNSKDKDKDRDNSSRKDVVSEALEAWMRSDEERSPEENQHNLTLLSSFKVLFETLLDLSVDPCTDVALMACTVVDYVVALLLDSSFMRVQGSATPGLLARKRPNMGMRNPSTAGGDIGASATGGVGSGSNPGQRPNGPNHQQQPPLKRSDTGTTATSGDRDTFSALKRNSSVANALRSFATMTGLVTPTTQETPDQPYSSQKQVAPTDSSAATITSSSSGAQYRSPYPEEGHTRVLPSEQYANLSHSISSSGIQYAGASGMGTPAGVPRSSTHTPHNLGWITPIRQLPPVSAVKVLEALTEEDMERLRLRRLRGTQAGGDNDGRFGNNGLPRSTDLGLGMVAKEVKDDVLPLRSGFYDWAMEYFREPQMKAPDQDEPGSKTYNQQAWRHLRNEFLVEESRNNEDYAATHAWDYDAGTLHNDAWPFQLAFHSFDPVLAVTDDSDNVCIWDWKARRKLAKFSNRNVAGSCISSIHFINEMASSLMLTASTEGSIRIWRDYDKPHSAELASTFRAVSDLYPVGHSSGVLTAWEQQKGHLLVGGDMKVVRLWDASYERHLRDIATQAGSNLTALASDEPDGNVFVAGFGDGVVRLFDKRAEDAGSVVLRTWRKHHTWIQSVHLQRGGQRELVTGSMNGEVRIWDVRAPDRPLYEKHAQKQGLMALAVHPGAPVFATTSAPTMHSTRQRLIIQGFSNPTEPKLLSKIHIPLAPNYAHPGKPIGFMPSAASLVFHPVEMVVAAGGFDTSGTVKMYKCPLPSSNGGGSGVERAWGHTNGHGHGHGH